MEASASADVSGPVERQVRKLFRLPSPRTLLAFVAWAFFWSSIHAVSDFSRGKRVDLDLVLASAAVWLVLFAVFDYKSWLEDEEEIVELTPEPFTSKASELPRLLKKAVEVMHLSADFEEANLGVWRALSYLSQKLDPEHRTAITEDALGDLKGFLASETGSKPSSALPASPPTPSCFRSFETSKIEPRISTFSTTSASPSAMPSRPAQSSLDGHKKVGKCRLPAINYRQLRCIGDLS